MSNILDLNLKEVVLKNDSFYKETYRDIEVHYVKGSDGSVYAISPNKGVRFCLSGITLESVQERVHKAIDFYYKVDWDKVEGK